MRSIARCAIALVTFSLGAALPLAAAQQTDVPTAALRVRFATFNVAMQREKPGQLAEELATGDSAAVRKIAEIIQRVQPDVLLLNEVDYDPTEEVIARFRRNYLSVAQNGQAPWDPPHHFVADVNTGCDSGEDLNRDGRRQTPDDAFGFGLFPGQYGMVVMSRHPIQLPVRTFQKFLWKDMPNAMWPIDPQSQIDFFPPEVKNVLRLSSKSHWDIPIQVGPRVVHVICAHPTPPVFDGREDRNGCRNHDEIRLIADYLNGESYIYDDAGTRGGLATDALFVVMGDMNADPLDGASARKAIHQLLDHPRVQGSKPPTSTGAAEASRKSGQANQAHRGDPAADTGDFNDRSVGNLRLDYVLPSKDLRVVGSGVFWPAEQDANADLASASDHHLVWVDIEFGPAQ